MIEGPKYHSKPIQGGMKVLLNMTFSDWTTGLVSLEFGCCLITPCCRNTQIVSNWYTCLPLFKISTQIMAKDGCMRHLHYNNTFLTKYGYTKIHVYTSTMYFKLLIHVNLDWTWTMGNIFLGRRRMVYHFLETNI